jgi:lipoprotein-anchoring transpeptidase ErfK/SrfK
MLPRIKRLVLFATVLVTLLSAAPAFAADELPPGGTFIDDDLLAEEGYIEAIAAADITRGCNPPVNDKFCPERTLTRGEMASIFVRALGLPDGSAVFTDTGDSIHAADIDALAGAGITKGCDPPANTRFCPDRKVTRGEMAAFIVRAFDLPGDSTDHFTDDDTIIFEDDINALAAAGITSGCGSGRFCPGADLPRREMAALIGKAKGLTPIIPPERPPPPYPQIGAGTGQRIIYSNSGQQVWLINEDETLYDTYLVTGRKGIPPPGRYPVFSKSVKAYAPYGGITMKHMVRFVRPYSIIKPRDGKLNQWSYGFHSIPRYPDGSQLHTVLGTFGSGGCVRQADHKAKALYEWTPIGTPVYVLP